MTMNLSLSVNLRMLFAVHLLTNSSNPVGTRCSSIAIMRKFFRFKSGTKTVKIPSICQDCLLCSHKKPYLELKGSEEIKNNPFAIPLTIYEWNYILEAFIAFLPDEPSPTEIRLGSDGILIQLVAFEFKKLIRELRIFLYRLPQRAQE